MSLIDEPGFSIALLAILVGLRLFFYVSQRMVRPVNTAAPVGLTPDAPGDELVMTLSTGAIAETPAATVAPATVAATTDASDSRFYAELLDAGIIAVILVFFLIRPFVLQAFYIPSGSMMPTLQEGDKLLATKFTYHLRDPHRGEVIVFNAPPMALQMLGQTYSPQRPMEYVKRVVGVPGDRLRVVANLGIFVNGHRLDESYQHAIPEYDYPVSANGDLLLRSEVAQTLLPNIRGRDLVVPKGYLFVLGDNRNQSHDSHAWGLLPRKAVVGKVAFIFWPPRRAGIVH